MCASPNSIALETHKIEAGMSEKHFFFPSSFVPVKEEPWSALLFPPVTERRMRSKCRSTMKYVLLLSYMFLLSNVYKLQDYEDLNTLHEFLFSSLIGIFGDM